MAMVIGSWCSRPERVEDAKNVKTGETESPVGPEPLHMKAKKLAVAVAQMKFRAAIDDNVCFIVETIGSCASAGVQAILFPECAVTGYNRDFAKVSRSEVNAALQRIASHAGKSRCYVLVGSPTFTGHRTFNSLVVFDPRGQRIFCYSKIHLTSRDQRSFTAGNTLAFFRLAGVPCTAIICHERRYPELVRLPVMLGAQIVFHPNAGLDSRHVSKSKRRGRDGIAVRAFENDVYYAFANSVGSQGGRLWSAGDSKIVAPDSRVLALANNRDETVVQAELDLSLAGRKYAREALRYPAFLREHWKEMMTACRRQLHQSTLRHF
jgi:predicted amidohydrolase